MDANNELMSNKLVGNCLEIEPVTKSLGVVDISNKGNKDASMIKGKVGKRKKWIRRKVVKKGEQVQPKALEVEIGKRQLVEMMVTEGTIEE